MFGLSVVQLVAGGVVLVVLAGSHWKAYVAGEHSVQRKWDAANVEQRRLEDDSNLLANRRGIRYAEDQMARQGRVVVITKEIDRAIQAAPAWAAEPVPAGVRDAIAAAGAALAASEPDGGLRVLPAAGRDERPAAGGLRLPAGGLRGLFGAASSPR